MLAYLHPISLSALAVLLINDHLLKGAGLLPDIVTGKLSDFAGLLFFPLLLAALLERVLGHTPTRRTVVVLCLLTGIGFSALQLSPPITELYRHALGTLFGPQHVRVTPDPTDLLALVVLPFTYVLWATHTQKQQRPLTSPELACPLSESP